MKQLYPRRIFGLLLSFFLFAGVHAQTYYSKSTGALNLLSTWGTSTNGSGTAPTSFTANNQVFVIFNNATPTITANWTVSGTGSYIQIGNSSFVTNFQIPANFTCTATINVTANATLSIANTTNPTLGTLGGGSTVVFNGSAQQTIPAVTYSNLTYANTGTAVSYFAGACTISRTFSVTSGNLSMDYTNNTAYTFTIGNLVVSTSGVVYFGGYNGTSENGSGKVTVNLSGDFTQTGSVNMSAVGTAVPNGQVNFTSDTASIQAYGTQWINYVVNNGAIATLAGNFAFAGDNSFPATFTVSSGGTLNCRTNVLQLTPGLAYSTFTLSSGASIITANTAGIASSGTSGSIQVNGTASTASYSSGANYTYNGSAAQISGVFTTTPTNGQINNLTIDNTSSTGVTLSQSQKVAGVLTLTDGILYTTTSTTTGNMLTVNSGGTTTGASNASFVDGYITKVGNAAFTFPVGKTGTGYVPIGISAPSATSDVFQAEYVRSSAMALGPITALGLDHVSGCDYWYLNHTTGTDAVNVTGYWSSVNGCGGTYINDLFTIVLAHFNGTSWNAFGNSGGTTGTTTAGSVTWNGVSTFSPFSLGSTLVDNPLPLTLVGFTAKWQTNETVGLTWQVDQEQNLDHFLVERSADGINWESIGTVASLGNSTTTLNYTYTDASPLASLDYYRLVMVADDGTLTYGSIAMVSASADNSGISVYPNPATDHLNISFSATSTLSGIVNIRLLNVQGQLLLQKSVVNPAGETVTLTTTTYPPGAYFVQIQTAEDVQQSRVVIIK
jgi:hypothetical protein